MSILTRIAFRLLRLEGYHLLDVQDSWNVVLAEKGTWDIESRARGLQDYSLHSTLSYLLNRLGIGLVLDVGAYVGKFAIRLRKAGYRARIVSFEPNPELHQNLRSLSANDPAWSIQQCGVGAIPEDRVFNVTQDRGFTSLGRPNEFAKRQFNNLATVDHEIVAPIRRLDVVLSDIFGSKEVPEFCLKTDTQGFDLQVYESLGELSKLCRLVLTEMPFQPIYENVPAFEEMSAFFKQRGFAPVEYYPVSRANDFTMIECDSLMLRTEK
jgi:FkbM family methyltransferase